MANKMTSRERVLTALKGGQPDRVPWVESYVHSSLANKILGREVPPIKGARFAVEIHEKLCLDNITYDFRPPIYAEKEMRGDLEMIREGWLKSWEDLEALKEWLPDPQDDAFYENADALLKQKGDYAAVVGLRLGISNVYNSMGYEDFIFAQISSIVPRYLDEWTGNLSNHPQMSDVENFSFLQFCEENSQSVLGEFDEI